MTARPEDAIRDAILLDLGAPGSDVWIERYEANAAGKFRFAGNGRRIFQRPLPLGFPDLHGTLTVRGVGVWLGIEVKSKRGQQSDDQRQFQGRATSRGGIYFTARSVEEAREKVNAARAEILARMDGGK